MKLYRNLRGKRTGAPPKSRSEIRLRRSTGEYGRIGYWIRNCASFPSDVKKVLRFRVVPEANRIRKWR
jgi:hypothetical protein